MNKVSSSEFQSNYQRLDEPVVVMARSRTLGTWYPKGTEPVLHPDHDDEAELLAEIKYLKSELAKRLTTKVTGQGQGLTLDAPGFGHSTPAPKP